MKRNMFISSLLALVIFVLSIGGNFAFAITPPPYLEGTVLSFDDADFAAKMKKNDGTSSAAGKLIMNSDSDYTYGSATYSGKLDLAATKWGTDQASLANLGMITNWEEYDTVHVRFYSTKDNNHYTLCLYETGRESDPFYYATIYSTEVGWQTVDIPFKNLKKRNNPTDFKKICYFQIRTDDNKMDGAMVGSGQVSGLQMYFDKIWITSADFETELATPSASVQDGEGNVPAELNGSNQLVYTFNKKLCNIDYAPAVTVKEVNGVSETVTEQEYSVSADENRLVIAFEQPLNSPCKYKVEIDCDYIYSKSGAKLGNDIVTTFAVGKGMEDFKVISVTPENGTTNYDIDVDNFEYVITFNNDLSETEDYRDFIEFSVKTETLNKDDFRADVQEKDLILTLEQDLQERSLYKVKLLDTFVDADGNSLVGDREFSFTTAKAPVALSADGVVFSAQAEDDLSEASEYGGVIVNTEGLTSEKTLKFNYVPNQSIKQDVILRKGDISGYSYINYLIYNNSDDGDISFVLTGKNGYKSYSYTPERTGWQIVSIPIYQFMESVAEDVSLIEKYSIDFSDKTSSGSILIDRIWFTDSQVNSTLEITDTTYEDFAVNIDNALNGDLTYTFSFNQNLCAYVNESAVSVEKYVNGSYIPYDAAYEVSTSGKNLEVKFLNELNTNDTIKIEVLADKICAADYSLFNGSIERTFTVGGYSPYFMFVQSDIPQEVQDLSDKFVCNITFNNPVDKSQNLQDYIAVYENGTKKYNFYSYSVKNNVVTIAFNSTLKADSVYKIEIAEDYCDINNNPMGEAYVIEFITAKLVSDDSLVIFSSNNDTHMNDVTSRGAASESTENIYVFSKNARIRYNAGKDKSAYLSYEVFNASNMSYFNCLMYSPEVTDDSMNFIFYTNKEDNKYQKYPYEVNWQGWKVVSLPLSELGGSWHNIDAVMFNFGGWGTSWEEDGYIDVSKVWFSKEQAKEPVIKNLELIKNITDYPMVGGRIVVAFEDELMQGINPVITVSKQIDENDTENITGFETEIKGNELIIKTPALDGGEDYIVKIDKLISCDYVMNESPIELHVKTDNGGVHLSEIVSSGSVQTGNSISVTGKMVSSVTDNNGYVLNIVSYKESGNTESSKSKNIDVTTLTATDSISVTSETDHIIAYVADENGNVVGDRFLKIDKNGTEEIFGREMTGETAVSVKDYVLNNNVATMSASVSGQSDIIKASVKNGNTVLTEELLSTNGTGAVDYHYIFADDAASGLYTIKFDGERSSATCEVRYISKQDREKITQYSNGDAASLSNMKAVVELMGDSSYTNEQMSEICSKIVLNKPYNNFDEAKAAYNKTVSLLNTLNSMTTWQSIPTFIGNNGAYLYANDADVVYYNSLNGEKPKNAVAQKMQYDLPFTGFEDFRLSLSAAVAAYKNELNNPGNQGGGTGGGSGGGGSSAGGSGITSADIKYQPVAQSNTVTKIFDDLSNYSWAADSIMSLCEKGIIAKPNDKKFRPADNITREEFTKMMVVALYSGATADDHKFTDETDGAWYNYYLDVAYEKNLISGYGDGSFGIGKNITREDMITIACRAIIDNENQNYGKNSGFLDESDISEYAVDYVRYLKLKNLINGDENGCFRPKDFATRAEAAKFLSSVLAVLL